MSGKGTNKPGGSRENSGDTTLARLWQEYLTRCKMTDAYWDKLISQWREDMAKVIGQARASSIRTNTGERLSKDKISWTMLYRALQIVNSLGKYRRITVTLSFEEPDGTVLAIETDVINRENGDGEPSGNDPYTPSGRAVLRPGDTAVPAMAYYVSGFGKSPINGVVLTFNGVEPLCITDGAFDGHVAIGNHVLNSDGLPSIYWSIE